MSIDEENRTKGTLTKLENLFKLSLGDTIWEKA